MSELSFEQMLEESLKTIRTGEVVTGKVIDVKEDEIVLNIGYKSDGIITRSEYTNESNVDLRDLVHVGDEMEAKVVKVNDGEGQVALSYKRLAADRGNKRLEEANYRLLKQGVSIDTEPLVKLVEQLKDQENAYYKNLLISEGVDVNDEQVELFREVDKKVSDMRYVPAYRCRHHRQSSAGPPQRTGSGHRTVPHSGRLPGRLRCRWHQTHPAP